MGSPGVFEEKISRKGSSGGTLERLRKHREHCGHENRREGSWPEWFVF